MNSWLFPRPSRQTLSFPSCLEKKTLIPYSDNGGRAPFLTTINWKMPPMFFSRTTSTNSSSSSFNSQPREPPTSHFYIAVNYGLGRNLPFPSPQRNTEPFKRRLFDSYFRSANKAVFFNGRKSRAQTPPGNLIVGRPSHCAPSHAISK